MGEYGINMGQYWVYHGLMHETSYGKLYDSLPYGFTRFTMVYYGFNPHANMLKESSGVHWVYLLVNLMN